MSNPRLKIDISKIEHNARVLVRRLGTQGISVTGVTKASLGFAPIAAAMCRGGVSGIGDSRLGNLEALQGVGPAKPRDTGPLWLLRSPMLSEASSVVSLADLSSNTELDVISALSNAAIHQVRRHGVVLMIQLGDLREGILPGDLHRFIRQMQRFSGISLQGVGTNLACLSGVVPDARNMAELSSIACSIEKDFAMRLEIVSGGNSANLNWAASSNAMERGRVNNLRLGEAILLGREATERQIVAGLYADAFVLIAEVIEAKQKSVHPRGAIGQPSLSVHAKASAQTSYASNTTRFQSILAIGVQDTDPLGLTAPAGVQILGASSDHLVVETETDCLRVGSEIAFSPDYSALMRAMTSPFVTREIHGGLAMDLGRAAGSKDSEALFAV